MSYQGFVNLTVSQCPSYDRNRGLMLNYNNLTQSFSSTLQLFKRKDSLALSRAVKRWPIMPIVYRRQRALCRASAVNNLQDGERAKIVVMGVMMTVYEQENNERILSCSPYFNIFIGTNFNLESHLRTAVYKSLSRFL